MKTQKFIKLEGIEKYNIIKEYCKVFNLNIWDKVNDDHFCEWLKNKMSKTT